MKKNRPRIVRTNEAELIAQVKQQFVYAPLGDFPTIEKLIKQLGVDDDSLAIHIKETSIKESWLSLREQNLVIQQQISSVEIKATLLQKNLESVLLLQNLIKTTARLDIQYLQTGQVKSLDGLRVLNYLYDSRQISALLLAFTAILQSSSQINGFADSYNNQNSLVHQFDQEHLNTIQKIKSMSLAELDAEAKKLEQTIQVLAKPTSVISIEQLNRLQEKGY